MKYPVLLFGVLSAAVYADGTDNDIEFSAGIAGSVTRSAYDARQYNYNLFPVINYDNDIWYIEGAEAGYYLLNDERNELRLNAFYDDNEFIAKNGRGALRHLRSRHATIMAGFSYQRITPIGAFYVQLAADTLNHSQGLAGNLAWLYLYQQQDWVLASELGVAWANAQQNRYYYGITQKEAIQSGLSDYRPHQSMAPYTKLVIDYAFSPHWDSYIKGGVDFLSSTQRNSPMVKYNQNYTITWGINYQF
ncbi:MipA/OmpV family protein [Enterobacteriaceae bacterium LUAb1]